MSHAALPGLQKSFDVELTYTSNAIEVGGKTLRDHLEAVDHYNAVLWIREMAAVATVINETAVRELHRRIVARSQPEIGGVYSMLPRRVAGSPVIFPIRLRFRN